MSRSDIDCGVRVRVGVASIQLKAITFAPLSVECLRSFVCTSHTAGQTPTSLLFSHTNFISLIMTTTSSSLTRTKTRARRIWIDSNPIFSFSCCCCCPSPTATNATTTTAAATAATAAIVVVVVVVVVVAVAIVSFGYCMRLPNGTGYDW